MSKDYTSEELHDIAEKLIEDLRDCEDGTKMSTHWLLKEAGYDIEEFDVYDLFEIHNALFEAAERNEITLDMSAYDDQVVGLPFNLYYIVKNESGNTFRNSVLFSYHTKQMNTESPTAYEKNNTFRRLPQSEL